MFQRQHDCGAPLAAEAEPLDEALDHQQDREGRLELRRGIQDDDDRAQSNQWQAEPQGEPQDVLSTHPVAEASEDERADGTGEERG
jgi:hypothetical protein